MERFDADVGSARARLSRLQKFSRPLVWMLAVHVGDGVVNNSMHVIGIQAAIAKHRISEESRASFNMLFDDRMDGLLLSVGKDHGADLSAALKDSEDHGFVAYRRS